MDKKFSILIVDDTPENIFLLESVLENEYICKSASNGNETFEVLKTFEPDLILLDIMMPGISGIEICRILSNNEKYSDIPIIMVTAKIEGNDVKEALEAGAMDYIKKPFSKIELLARMNSALKLRKYIKELKDALLKVKTLSGLLPICSKCKKIRDDKGYWAQVEEYMANHSDLKFTHGICPECFKELYPDYYNKEDLD